jgi:hypothetical protein
MGLKGKLAQLILSITNLAYFLGGLTVLIIGALAIDNPSALEGLLSYVPNIEEFSKIVYLPGVATGPAIYLIVSGSIVLLLSIVGCGGAFKRNKILLVVFGLITLLMMLFNIAVIMFYAIDPYFIEDNVKHNMNETLKDFQPVNITQTRVQLPMDDNAQAWVTMQFEQGCCGINGVEDYLYVKWDKTNLPVNTSVPPSCCLLKQPYSIPSSTNDFVDLDQCLSTASLYTNNKGCSEYVMQQATRYNIVYCIVAATFTGLQAIILCLTLWLFAISDGSSV